MNKIKKYIFNHFFRVFISKYLHCVHTSCAYFPSFLPPKISLEEISRTSIEKEKRHLCLLKNQKRQYLRIAYKNYALNKMT